MKVGILGSGAVGQRLGAGFAKYGHEVKMGTRKAQDDAIRKWVAATPRASAGSFAEATAFGDFLVLCVAGLAVESVIGLAGASNFCNGTRYTMYFDLVGHGIGKLFAMMGRRMARKQIPLDQARLKERLEKGK